MVANSPPLFILDMRLKIEKKEYMPIPQRRAWYIIENAGFLLLSSILWTLIHRSWSKLRQIVS